MAKFRIDRIAELSRQLEFTPREARAAQLEAAEELLHTLDPLKAYPFEFVIFRITGYHPRALSEELLAGLALQHDLGLLIEQTSRSLNLRADAMHEPVLSIDDLTERFNVSSKSIQRWRRRGLPARLFLFADGRLRVGFLLSSVERFLRSHRQQREAPADGSQLQEPQVQQIVRQARDLMRSGGCCEMDIAWRVGRAVGRCALAVLHVLRKHDREHPHDPVLAWAAAPIGDAPRQKILRGYRHGKRLGDLSHRLGRPRWVIYRAILSERIERLMQRKTRFIDDPLYHQPQAAGLIQQLVQQDTVENDAAAEQRVPRDLPPYLADLYRTQLLSASRERGLFLKFNFHKYQFAMARRRLDPQRATHRDVRRLEEHLHAATDTKNQIVRANLRLVVSVARKHLRPGLSLMELISDGNLTLLRAVESFDVHRGNRFSTYATLALMKGFARSVPRMLAGAHGVATDQQMLDCIPDRRQQRIIQTVDDREQLRLMLSRLDECEQTVLRDRFGLGSRPAATYEQLGERLGMSNHRVRQIALRAMEKLRDAAQGAAN